MAGLYQRRISPNTSSPAMQAAQSQGAGGAIPRGASVSMPQQEQGIDAAQLGGLLGMVRNGGDVSSGMQPSLSAGPMATAQSAWSNGQIGQNGALNPYTAQNSSGAGHFGPGMPMPSATGATGIGNGMPVALSSPSDAAVSLTSTPEWMRNLAMGSGFGFGA